MDLKSDELSDLNNQLLGPVENQIKQFNKKAAGQGWNALKRVMATVTEPYFRAGMGERYYTPESFAGGMGLWALGTCVAFFGTHNFEIPIRSIIQLILSHTRFHFVGNIFAWPGFCILCGAIMIVGHFLLSMKNAKLVRDFRQRGILYHTMSRGKPRFGRADTRVLCFIVIILALFDLPVAILFLAGYFYNEKLISEQQAAIQSKYWDAVDRRAEDLYLEGGALGELPLEYTYLAEQLDPSLNPIVRNDMAAALVDKPVLGMARPPQSKKKPNSETATGSKPSMPRQSEPVSQTGQNKASAPVESPFSKKDAQIPIPELPWRKILLVVLIIILGVVLYSVGRMCLSEFSHRKITGTVQTVQGGSEPAQTPPLASASPAAVDVAATQSTLENQQREEQEKIIQEPQKTVDQFKSLIADKVGEFNDLKEDCEKRLDDNTNKIAGLSWAYRSSLQEQNEKGRLIITKSLDNQQKSLEAMLSAVQLFSSDPSGGSDKLAKSFRRYTQMMSAVHQKTDVILGQMDESISNAPVEGK